MSKGLGAKSQTAEIIDISAARSAVAERKDDELVLLARGGSEQAFATLVKRHQHFLLALAWKYTGHRAIAEDAVQNAFLAFYDGMGRYRPEGKLRSYLAKVVLNQCKMISRSDARRIRRQLHSRDFGFEQPATEEQILAQERERELQRALQKLPHKLKSVVVLRYAGDCSYQEISHTLGIPTGTVKSRMFAGLEKLRDYLSEVEL